MNFRPNSKARVSAVILNIDSIANMSQIAPNTLKSFYQFSGRWLHAQQHIKMSKVKMGDNLLKWKKGTPIFLHVIE